MDNPDSQSQKSPSPTSWYQSLNGDNPMEFENLARNYAPNMGPLRRLFHDKVKDATLPFDNAVRNMILDEGDKAVQTHDGIEVTKEIVADEYGAEIKITARKATHAHDGICPIDNVGTVAFGVTINNTINRVRAEVESAGKS